MVDVTKFDLFEWPTVVGSTESTQFKTKSNEFEDYTQTTSVGINNKRRSYSLSYVCDTIEESDKLKKFLDDHKGVYPFRWKLPNRTQEILVKCGGYDSTFNGNQVESLSFQFTEHLDF